MNTDQPVKVDRREHVLLGERRADQAEVGECAWTLLTQNAWPVRRYVVTALERMPYPAWWLRP